MFYRYENKIVSMNDVKSIELKTFGSWSKSNPFCHYIEIDYFNGENETLSFNVNEDKAKTVLSDIFEKLTKNA